MCVVCVCARVKLLQLCLTVMCVCVCEAASVVSDSVCAKPLQSCLTLCVCAKPLQSCLILWDPLDCSPPGSRVHGILQARMLRWAALLQGIFRPRDQICISCTAGGSFATEQTGAAPGVGAPEADPA